VQAYTLPPRSLAEIKETLDFLDAGQRIVIGESASRVMEGEPLTHPQFAQVLQMVRARFSTTPMGITTNGSLLDAGVAADLAGVMPIEVNLSLNTCSPKARRRLMGDTRGERTVQAMDLLVKAGIPWHGSVVAMPWLTGWEELGETLQVMARKGARTIRVFLPGYTRLAPPELRLPPGVAAGVAELVAKVGQETDVPILIEPPQLTDLNPVVAGVMAGTPASRAGISQGDIIRGVNGSTPWSRVDAFRLVQQAANPVLELERQGRLWTVTLAKGKGETSGLVVEYDLHPQVVTDILRTAKRRGARQVLVLCSRAGYALLPLGLAQHRDGRFPPQPGVRKDLPEIRFQQVDSQFFGGSIHAAGLLVVEDFIGAVQEYQDRYPDFHPELVVMPSVAFDHLGRDLTGRSFLDLVPLAGCPVEIL